MSCENKGLVIVISSPSGGGKGTILKKLIAEEKSLKLSVSATTRQPREGEINGQHYFFITKDEFIKNIESGKMLEYAEYCDNYYGTPEEPVKRMTEDGFDVILEIEVQGGALIKKKIPDCVSIFIVPPSIEVLAQRLTGRGTEDTETINKRLNQAKKEIPTASEYDYIVVNDEVDNAVNKIKSIIAAEKAKSFRNINKIEELI